LYGINSVSSLLLGRHCDAIFSLYWPIRALGYGVAYTGISCYGIPSSTVFVVVAISRKLKPSQI